MVQIALILSFITLSVWFVAGWHSTLFLILVAVTTACWALASGKRKPISVYRSPPIYGDPFLDSRAWHGLRYKVLQTYGGRCMCCGRTAEDGIKINVDHIKSRKLRPDLALSFDNLQVLCWPCNQGKGWKDDTDWRPRAKIVEPIHGFGHSIN